MITFGKLIIKFMDKTLEYYWNTLKNLIPNEVVDRCLVSYKDNAYEVDFLNEKYYMFLNDKKIIDTNNLEVQNYELILLILFYLINSKNTNVSE